MAAGFGTQANALFRKSAVYQRRNVGTNICLVSSPIFFCIILLAIKIIVDKLFLTQDSFKCGCACVECCQAGTGKCINNPYCRGDATYECRKYDDNNCGLEYSDNDQAQWCKVANPSIWAPMLTVPKAPFRAAPNGPALTTLITAPKSPSFTGPQLSPYIYPTPPSIDNETLINILSNIMTEDGAINSYLLSKYGIAFGTTSEASYSLFVDTGFLDGSLYLLVPYSNTFNCSMLTSIFPPSTSLLSGRNTTLPPPNLNSTKPNLIAVPVMNMLVGLVNATSNTTLTLDEAWAHVPDSDMLSAFLDKKVGCLNVLFSDEPDVDSMDKAVYCGFKQSRCNGTSVINEYPLSYEYYKTTSDSLSFSLYYNGTDKEGPGNVPLSMRLNTGLSGAVMAWLNNTLMGNTGLVNAVRLLGTMAMPKRASKLKLDLSALLGPLFYTWVVQMLLPTFLQLLVYEKEKRLRMMMKMHGLGDGAYWLVTYLWYLLLYIIYIIIFILFGAAIGLEIFRRTNLGVQIIFYFLFGNNMIALAFMLSSFFSSSRTSTVVAFLYVFATGLIGELLLRIFMEDNESWVFFIEWIPAFALYRGLWEMSQYAFLGVYQNSVGLNFSRLSDGGCGMLATWGIFVVEWAIFMILGWYFEQVISNGTGIHRHPLFFLQSCMKRRKAPANDSLGTPRASIELANGRQGSEAAKRAGGGSENGSFRLTPDEHEDVRAERLRVEALQGAELSSIPIVVRDLRKVYPPLDGGKPKVAVRTLTMAIERGECFGLLGPNGAGKSTSINMLTGFLEPTSGTASIEGLDITTQMPKIYSLMGVCPQHDLLWEQLTGEEHLLFYGRLKGLKGAELTDAVTVALKSVNLFNGSVGKKQSKKYSGGMKRRLSVAISFIGNPQVVYLDEPSTGLDPASRRNLWDVVRSNKDGRATILTTHSMEEAEILCDRLGIFVDGQLVCIGNPREITSRYAGYLVFTITVGSGHEDAAKAFVAHMSPNARLTYALGATFKYELPTTDVSLAAVFDAMATAKTQMQVLDWGVANATLEEVFIKFARQIGAETKDQ
ncbi:hypothetical protein Vretimale_837 [Volvox reticuliferus]|uniref:Uncharacterized protein n=1 Tax=Volvox reticuliferus TaxID=1737510 RepID=A0A8J4D2P9_9CHLO|nr:hypothetical protein Vretifemale_2234 [Volvox reticuliferus]GIL94606.1 hypothetical protein Vretimale_837 [Volvox reticuliferus]